MVAFHYPPAGFSSGVHRTLCFANDLVDLGWSPTVLTASPNAYPTRFDDTCARIRPEVTVTRGWTINSAQTLAVAGRYLRGLALPDRWSSWILSGVIRGLQTIRRQPPKALWSTYPIASAHVIGLILHRLTGLPWVADFRDPMYDQHFPNHPWERRSHQWIEAKVMRHARFAVVTTEGTAKELAQRHATKNHDGARYEVIANGYDPQLFVQAPKHPGPREHITLLHSGLLDPADRPPQALLNAIRVLNTERHLPPIRLHLRAPGNEGQLNALIKMAGCDDAVRLLPPLPCQAAINEICQSDALVLLQGPSCPNQIPAKLYEYMRSERPVLGLCSPNSETAQLLRHAGVSHVAQIDNNEAVTKQLARLRLQLVRGDALGVSQSVVETHSRTQRARELNALLRTL
ncbi:glycosyltransferase [Motiliproteus sp. SC1-56]|uniref:glycosyltransferase n=1 Tax=Motiliproteus sp. SC1-56 TaxID=2799565 RepID=UPI001A8DAFDB|nr:glycosyltransferase [Motiliproteus sp. SC1-56]